MAFDIIVIGAGIAGSSAAAFLSCDRSVALIEAEEVAGYHTTGRSVAIWQQNYGPHDIRLLSVLSRPFFETPPDGFTEARLLHPRPVLFLQSTDTPGELDQLMQGSQGLERISIAECQALVPALKPASVSAAAIERNAFDMDINSLHQGFLRQLRARGGELALRNRAGTIARAGDAWHVETTGGGDFRAPILINAAGAWGDQIAALAGVAPIGLRPLRRTIAVINPEPYDVADWPMVNSTGRHWYTRPEARTRLLVSPQDQTPDTPHDVQPEEIDIAEGIDRMQQHLDIQVRRVERSWAGLRTFTQDGSLAIGWEKTAPGFFWCCGQGGYGIQTAPAAGQLVADLVLGRDPGAAAPLVAMLDPGRFRKK